MRKTAKTRISLGFFHKPSNLDMCSISIRKITINYITILTYLYLLTILLIFKKLYLLRASKIKLLRSLAVT